MKTIQTEITINGTAKQVWETLMRQKDYPKWNPFIKSLEGVTNTGEVLKVKMQLPGKKPMTFQPKVLISRNNKEFRWKGKLFVEGLFDGEHYFVLEDIGINQCRLVHGEVFTGILSGIFLKRIGEDTKKGFELMNQAIKERVEAN